MPFPPGGGADNVARSVTSRVSEILGHAIVIENRPGAGGSVGSEAVARAPVDSYTSLYGTNRTHGINLGLYAKTGLDPVKDFAPVSRASYIPPMLVVIPSVPQIRSKNCWLILRPMRANCRTHQRATEPSRMWPPKCSSVLPVSIFSTFGTKASRNRRVVGR